MKVIDSLWFTNIKGCIGIIIIEEDVTGDRKAYIGPVSGADEKADTGDIISLGNKFSLETAKRILYVLKKEQIKREELLKRLIELQAQHDPEEEHKEADKLLLQYIDDASITRAFTEITRWYG